GADPGRSPLPAPCSGNPAGPRDRPPAWSAPPPTLLAAAHGVCPPGLPRRARACRCVRRGCCPAPGQRARSWLLPVDADRDVGKLHLDGRMGFVHGDLDGRHGERAQHMVRNPFGQRFDQLQRLAGDDRFHLVRELGVVGGFRQVVAGRGGPDVRVQRNVHDEPLTVTALLFQHAVVAHGGNPAELDDVRARRLSYRHGPPYLAQAAATLTASREAPASCTRTPHAPLAAASAETASVAWSRSLGAAALPAVVSNEPRNRLREAPTSSLCPSWANCPVARSSSQLCSAFLEKPRPGSRMICSGATPAATNLSRSSVSSARTSATTSWYSAFGSAWRASPRR